MMMMMTMTMMTMMMILYSALPRKHLRARGAVHYQHQTPLDNINNNNNNKKYYKCIHQCQHGKNPGWNKTIKKMVSSWISKSNEHAPNSITVFRNECGEKHILVACPHHSIFEPDVLWRKWGKISMVCVCTIKAFDLQNPYSDFELGQWKRVRIEDRSLCIRIRLRPSNTSMCCGLAAALISSRYT